MNLSDKKRLISKCRKGNKKSQLKMYNLYCDAMFHISLRIVNNTEVAQEVMQDSFLNAFEKLDSFNEEKGTFGGWLKRIVINNSINYLRNNRTIYFEEVNEIEAPLEKEEKTEVVNKSDYQKFKLGMEQIKENYKVILTLHYMEGYTLDEIGGILNISYSNTRTMLTRAKQSLKKKVNAL